MIVLAYLMIFPAFVALRIRRPDSTRPFRVPGGTASLAGVDRRHRLGTARQHLPAVARLRHGGSGRVAAGRFRGRATEFELLVLIPVALVVLTRLRVLRARASGPDVRVIRTPRVAG